MVHQLMDKVPAKELEKLHVDTTYAIHGRGIHPSDSNGVPFTAAYIESMEDPIANLNEDLAAEQKARATYEYLINMAEDPDVIDPLRFLREREVVHYQRFGEALRIVQETMDKRKYYPLPNLGKPENMEPMNMLKSLKILNLQISLIKI